MSIASPASLSPEPSALPLPARSAQRTRNAERIAARIRAAQLEQCFDATVQGQLVSLINGVLLALFLRPVVPAARLEIWLMLLLAAVVVRIRLYTGFRRQPPDARALVRWERLNLAGITLSGVVWASASALLFVADSLPHQVLLSFVLGGMAAGSVTTLSVQRHAARLFAALALIPLTLRFASSGHEFASGMTCMLAIFTLMMLVSAVRFHRNHSETLAEGLRREAAEEDLAQIAYYDPLTDLPNRRLFTDFTMRASASARRRGTAFAVCYLDLDNFKPLNDRHGYELGDQVLVRAAELLRDSVRAGDVVARWGGDEFAVLLGEVADAEACAATLQRLIEALSRPQMVDGVAVELGASIGATLGPGASDDPDCLLRQADHAMYLAKRAGRNGFHLFDPDTDGEDRRLGEARQSMRAALANGEIVMHVQPKVEMDSGRVYGAEALVRWAHPERGLLPPAAFLPLWESDPAMAELDRWMIARAFAQVEAWLVDDLRVVLSVNVSTWLLHDRGFIPFLETLVQAHPQARGLIEIEVTETRALDDVGHISEVMTACAALDVRFALDDFGTGFSSLVHLQRLPAHALKIDTTFVRAMLKSENDRKLVRGIIGLGQSLGKQVVAEGVESVAHGSALLLLGCRRAQGYGIARPMPAAELPGWAAGWSAPPAWQVPSSGDLAMVARRIAV